MDGISLRSPGKADALSLARIWVENCRYYAEMDPDSFQVPNEDGLIEWFESFFDNAREDQLSLVAEVDGEVVGSIEARLLRPVEDANRQMLRELGENRLSVEALIVDRAHWRSGVGTALMEAAEVWAKERGAAQSGTYTYIDSPVSVPFYEKLGYIRRSINLRKPL
jgi:GNAT superfamily N-acetyltransferase